MKKLTAKMNWFKKKGNKEEKKVDGNRRGRKKGSPPAKELEPVTVMFIPRTPGGELLTRLRKAEEELSTVTGDRVKLVEKSGKMLKRSVVVTDPTAGSNCGREKCLVCHQGDEKDAGRCKKRNVTYQTTCHRCKETGKKVNYFGESSRTGFERGVEHWADYLSRKEDSHMWKHVANEHPNQPDIKFSMKIMKSHKSALQRQVHEAILIELHEGEPVLNSKGEYNRCKLPRLAVMFGDKENDSEERKESTEMSNLEIEEEIHYRKESKRRENQEGKFQPKSKRRKRYQVVENEKQRKRKEIPEKIESVNKKLKINKYVKKPEVTENQHQQGKNVLEEGGKINDVMNEVTNCNKEKPNIQIQGKKKNIPVSIEKKIHEKKETTSISSEKKIRTNPKNTSKFFPIFKTTNQEKSENKAHPSLSPASQHHHPQPNYQGL